jgi:hypothetical protein
MSDPETSQGLAHFLEHLLFMGTEKYPNEAEYSMFLSEHGGSSNAYTGSEDTNYFFDVAADHLEPALDRFVLEDAISLVVDPLLGLPSFSSRHALILRALKGSAKLSTLSTRRIWAMTVGAFVDWSNIWPRRRILTTTLGLAIVKR